MIRRDISEKVPAQEVLDLVRERKHVSNDDLLLQARGTARDRVLGKEKQR